MPLFNPVPSQVDFPALEHRMLEFWDATQAFDMLVEKNRGHRRYSFLDGPITANNPMGVHHAWGRTYKDLFQRRKAMQGYDQRYQNGFDCQGLWIEVEVEKELGFKSKRDIEAYGIGRFVEKCKERVRKFSDIQTQQSIRLGYWMHWDDSYYTMSDENNYTIWHFLKKCYDNGWIYKGNDVMPWCPRCGTGLSEHEIVTEGYKELTHKSIYLKFPLHERPGEFLIAWTTTPWTLTSNVAAAVHPELVYAKVRQGDEVYYLSKAPLPRLVGKYELLGEVPGSDLVGLTYSGPFDELPVQQGVEHRVIPWDEVSEEEGTGIVHIAPGCGKEDFGLSKQFGLAVIAPIDEYGVYVDGFDWLTGKSVGEVAEPIIASLKQKGVLYRVEPYTHRYPVCWRCNSELVFRLVSEWFISMDEVRPRIQDVTRKIHWLPDYGMDRELDWLANMHDWMISKKRYWGLALPIYECSCGHFEVIGGKEELRERAVEGWEEFEGNTPHRPWVDAVKIRCPKCGQVVSRIKDVGNPWLDAGIVPYSTLHYLTDHDYWEKWFPAEFITECFPGQFRNWFYSLLTMSTVLENREPFETVLGHALIRDEHGEEMHKSKGNAIWFDDAAEKVGADVMRWMFARHNPEINLNFGYGPAEEVRRRMMTLWNVYSFFVTYANLDNVNPTELDLPVAERSELDRWIIARLNAVLENANQRLDDYDAMDVIRSIEDFIEDLSNWYVRRSRRRFWKSEADTDKRAAYLTLYECLTTLNRLLAPVVPFMMEEMYQNLVRSVDSDAPVSVHHCAYPEADRSLIDERLIAEVDLVRSVASLGRAARSKANIKVRQPLQEALVATKSDEQREALERLSRQVLDELNVKELRGITGAEDVLSYVVKPNLPVLGPKYGRQLGAIRRFLQEGDQDALGREFAAGQTVSVPVDGQAIELSAADVLLERVERSGYAVAEEGDLVVGVTTELTPALKSEGLAREIVRRIQDMRKSAGFDIADTIRVGYEGSTAVEAAMRDNSDYIRRETLAVDLVRGVNGGYRQDFDIEGESAVLSVEKQP